MSYVLAPSAYTVTKAIEDYCQKNQRFIESLEEERKMYQPKQRDDMSYLITAFKGYEEQITKLKREVSKSNLEDAAYAALRTYDMLGGMEGYMKIHNVQRTDASLALSNSSIKLYEAIEQYKFRLSELMLADKAAHLQKSNNEISQSESRNNDSQKSNNQDNPAKKSNGVMAKYVALPALVCSSCAACYVALYMPDATVLLPILNVHVNAAYTTAGVAGIICAVSTIMILYYGVNKGDSIPSKDNRSTKLCNPQSNLYMSQDTMQEYSYGFNNY